MKMWICMLIALMLAVWFLPIKGADVGDLQPVELIQVYRERGKVVMETDTGDLGRGRTLQKALEDLQNTTPGKVFLETADYLLLTDDAKKYIPDLFRLLRPGTEVCRIEEKVRGEKAAEYLASHPPTITLQAVQYRFADMPELKYTEGRFKLVE